MINNQKLAEDVNNLQYASIHGEYKRPLGRLISRDDRDHNFPMHLALDLLPLRASASAVQSSARYWDTGKVLNQGSTNHCVGFSMRSFLDASPFKTHGGKDGNEIYYAATEVDEWPASHNEDGTSVRAGAKVLQSAGHIAQYVFGYDVQTLAQFIFQQGTVIVGTNWYAEMDNPKADDGFLLHPSGGIVGGHAWHIVGVDQMARTFKMKNSWGEDWAKRGFAYIRFDELTRLLAENGEAVAMLEQAIIITPVR